MKRVLTSFVLQFLFWLLFFAMTRLVFFLFHLDLLLIEHIGIFELLYAFVSALKLDVATTCYIMIIPFFILLIQSVRGFKVLDWINRIYVYILIVVYSLTTAGEMGIYREWKTKLTYKVINYLNHPGEIYNSAQTGTFFILVLLFLVISIGASYCFTRFFYVFQAQKRDRNLLFSAIFLVITPFLLFIGLRGGFQPIPINQSEAYYSDHNILNTAAVNTAFNLYISIFENLQNIDSNPYIFMEEKKADEIISKIYQKKCDSTIYVLKSDRPNIVILILESWSSDLIADLGGEPGITPQFSKLVGKGILFDNIYSTGSRSEQGMASIFGGFPAHPISSITVQPDKFVKLPSLVKEIKREGYQTGFYFGGQLIYGNIKSYIIFNGFGKVMEVYDFPREIPRGKLGVHDQFTLQYMLDDIDGMKQPFMTSLFTLSTHSPWDQPFAKPLKWGENEQEYLNAAYYTDHCLGLFFEKARTKPWFKNTLFIIVADHSHNSYRNWHPQSREYHLIPFLWYGDVIRDQFLGTRVHKTGNQHDLANTLLTQMGLSAKAFKYSKNLLDPCTPEFAYYSTDDGLGWVRPYAYFTYDKTSDYYYWWSNPQLADSVELEGKAYLQSVFTDYMSE